MKKKLLLIIPAVVLLLLLGAGSAFYFLGKAGKLPDFLQKKAEPVFALLERKKTTAAAPAKPVAEPAEQKPKKITPPPPPKPLPPPKPVTRPQLLAEVELLLEEYRSNPEKGRESFLKKADAFFIRYRLPATPEEQQAFDRLNRTYAALDERFRAEPERLKTRAAFAAKFKKYQAAKDAEQQAAEERRERESRSRQEEKKREAEYRQLQAASEAAEKERKRKLFSELDELKRKIAAGFLRAVQGEEKALTGALLEAKAYRPGIAGQSKEEREALKDFQSLQRDFPAELKRVQRFREELGKIKISLSQNGQAINIVSVYPWKCLDREYRECAVVLQDLKGKRRQKVFDAIRSAATAVPKTSAVFYFSLIRGERSAAGQKEIPRGFWQKNYPFVKPLLKKARY